MSSSDRSYVGVLFTNEEQKKETLAIHSKLVYGVTDVDHRAQNGSTHNHVFLDFQTSTNNNKKQNEKASRKRAVYVLFLHSILISMAHDFV